MELLALALEGLEGALALAREEHLSRRIEQDDEVRARVQALEHRSVQAAGPRPARALAQDVVGVVVAEEVAVEQDDRAATLVDPGDTLAEPLLGDPVGQAHPGADLVEEAVALGPGGVGDRPGAVALDPASVSAVGSTERPVAPTMSGRPPRRRLASRIRRVVGSMSRLASRLTPM